MWWRSLCLGLLLSCQTWTLIHSACHLITPSVLRADSDETFVIVLQGCQNQQSHCKVNIQIRDFPQKKTVLDEGQISVQQDNGFQGKIQLKIPSTKLDKDTQKKQFVSIIVNYESCKLEKVVLMSFQTGYIFIQTDKPIYTPGSKVMYRLFTLSPDLDPLEEKVIVEIKTSENVVVYQEQLVTKGLIPKTFKLTEPVSSGIWSISARYKKSAIQNYTTHFEVKEYVLPSFEIKLEPAKKFFYYKDEEFRVGITATYTYGESVGGHAFALFGVKGDGQEISITESLTKIELPNTDVIVLKKDALVNAFQSQEAMIGWKLTLTVAVITDSGSDLLEAKLEDIHIVSSPYKILFTKTPKYFKPGMTFDATVLVTNPDGSPASGVPVVAEPGAVHGTTRPDGTAILPINTEGSARSLTVKASTRDKNIASDQQASESMTAQAYSSHDGNYLYISALSAQVKLHDAIPIKFIIKSRTEVQIKHIFYLILCSGRIIKVGRLAVNGQSFLTEMLTVTKDYLPSFRVVAYYILNNPNAIVADSVWVDVEDSCAGTLELSPYRDSDKLIQRPGQSMTLKLQADHKAKVGLVAVDKGVYILNSKYKISQKKVWDAVEKYDTGCTPGSGANTAGVFHDAGLALHTDFGLTTTQRIEYSCQSHDRSTVTRKRRDTAMILQFKNTQASKYGGQDRTCCMDGMITNPMGQSCERRSRLIAHGENCVKAFLDCCRAIEKKKEAEKPGASELAREDMDTDYFRDSVIVRSQFPESWMWETKEMTETPDKNGISTKTLNVLLQDSITTWEVLAVSLSKGKGICVSKPHDIVVKLDAFIDLRLPYSVVRNEQVEIRAIIYNYGNGRLEGKVEWTYNKQFCSLSTAKKNYQYKFTVKPRSSLAVPFVIVPMELGLHEVEVKAYGQGISDGVMKILRVVPEGKRMVKGTTIVLDPVVKGKSGTQEEFISVLDLNYVVPNTKIETIVTVQGTPISDIVQETIDGENLNGMINLPSGCGEQVMMKMTSLVITTHFLDATNQWTRIGVDRRAEAISFINQGVTKELSFRKKDEPAYVSYFGNQPSTWLTAYVVRIFSLASNLTYIDPETVCDSVQWLIDKKQNPNGEFVDPVNRFTYGFEGGTQNTAERDSTLTAFVLIALLESQRLCSGSELRNGINKAVGYINQKYQSLKNSYSVAITSYALAKAGRLQSIEKLMSASIGNTYWGDNNAYSELSIEATAYASLALSNTGRYKETVPLADWLIQRKFHGKLYGSTQATLVMFEALVEYYKSKPAKEDDEMDVKFKLPGREDSTTHRINTHNALLARSESTENTGDFTVTATGTGTGVLIVKTIYYEVTTEKEIECKNFYLEASITDFSKTRAGEAKAVASLEICTRFLPSRDATMTVMEISMMTGFSPDKDELERLTQGVDRYVSKYEIDKGAFDKGMLVLYFDKISHEEDLCLTVKLKQYFDVGYIQPASVTVYEYYAKENRCTKFYHVEEDSKLLGRICVGEVCRCAEENCYMQQQLGKVDASVRYEKACEAGVDYVYKITVSSINEKENYIEYVMTITKVIKQGTDFLNVKESRIFISHVKCQQALNLIKGQNYIIWGVSKDLWKIEPEPSPKYAFMITKDTWIEWWPSDRECQEKNLDVCDELEDLADTLVLEGCNQ
ncbi:A.superbus venom factor 1-like [Hyperolius riggenbachi]|uniref:A.superbus venom factor 1-like n=1 Tax=Hyperolius riggenbachi TaxID=752182 RepID=UPI0035A29EFA